MITESEVGTLAIVGVVAVGVVSLAVASLRATGQLIHCPECDTTKLAQYGLGSFQRSFECENGHRFSIATEGP